VDKPTQRKSMVARTVIGIIMTAALSGVLWLDWHLEQTSQAITALPLTFVIVVLSLVAFDEMIKLLAAKGLEVLWVSGCLGVVALIALPIWWPLIGIQTDGPEGSGLLVLFGLLLLVIFLDQMNQQAIDTALLRISATALTILYLGVGGALILAIRLTHHMPLFLLFVGAVKVTDIGAYFVGSAIGKHRLVGRLSPQKSWEGLIGGLVCGTLVCLGGAWALSIAWPVWKVVVFAVAMGLAGQFADLCESLLKRSAQVKDSGRVLPQFGGVLDMLDSLLLAAPVAMILLAVLD